MDERSFDFAICRFHLFDDVVGAVGGRAAAGADGETHQERELDHLLHDVIFDAVDQAAAGTAAALAADVERKQDDEDDDAHQAHDEGERPQEDQEEGLAQAVAAPARIFETHFRLWGLV